MGSLLQDARYALRMMRHAPGFTAAATLALALGIGANTAIFSIVYGVLLKPLPYPDPDRLVGVLSVRDGSGTAHSLPDLADFRAQTSTLAAIGGYATGFETTLTESGRSRSVAAAFVTPDLFNALGIHPQRGRAFSAADDARGAARTAIISDAFWTERFNRAESALGQALQLDGQPSTIVGIMPAGFAFPIQADTVQVWAPIRTREFTGSMAEQRGAHFVQLVGRLAPGVSIVQAQADLATIAARLAQSYPVTNAGRGVRVESLHKHLVGEYETSFHVLTGAVLFLLLIACANVANLLLARNAVRRREIALRVALGASRARLVGQLLTESVLLSALGGSAGLLFAVWSIAGVTHAVPLDIPRLRDVSIDPTVLAFTATISILTGVLFGLAPALQSSHPDMNESLKDAARASGGTRSTRTRSVLVVSEVALALVLLVGAGLLMRSFIELRRVDPGFLPDRLLTIDLSLPVSQYSSDEKLAGFYRSLLEGLRSLPGAERVAVATMLPLTGSNFTLSYTVDGRPAPDPGDRPHAQYYGVSPDFFQTLGIPLLRGRLFSEADTASPKPTVAIVSESLARKHWPDADPIGQRITLGDARASREIVGVVGDVKAERLDQTASGEFYVLYLQRPWPFMSVAVRTKGDPLAVAPALRSRILEVNSALPVEKMTTMGEYVSRAVAEPRFNSLLLASFAALALTLSALGIYGVMAYAVAQRTREIGIRIALGAQPASVLRLVVWQGMRTAALGIVVGLAGAALLSHLLATLLFGVSVRDALTFSAVPALLALVALAACYIPARRAMRISPTVALRTE